MIVKLWCRKSLRKLEREKGFEPSTLALARRCSTTELFPPVRRWSSVGWQYINEPFVRCQDITSAVTPEPPASTYFGGERVKRSLTHCRVASELTHRPYCATFRL